MVKREYLKMAYRHTVFEQVSKILSEYLFFFS